MPINWPDKSNFEYDFSLTKLEIYLVNLFKFIGIIYKMNLLVYCWIASHRDAINLKAETDAHENDSLCRNI